MPKIPKVTGWNRVKNFLKGLLLYNTVYWERASDGLRPPRISQDERQQLRPKRDLSVIKPREKPRAKQELEERKAAVPAEPVPSPAAGAPQPPPTPSVAAEEGGEIRKRRKRRKVQRGNLRHTNPFKSESSGGSVKKWFRREE